MRKESPYKCLSQHRTSYGKYEIIPLRKPDIVPIGRWRNAQLSVLRQKKANTDTEQERYYDEVIDPTLDMTYPPQIIVSLIFDGKLIGYGGFVHIDWESKRAEVSFLLDPERAKKPEVYEEDFSHFLIILKKVAFEVLEFNRLHTETFDIRAHHVSILEKQGFRLEGRMKNHVWIKNRHVDSLIHGCLRSEELC